MMKIGEKERAQMMREVNEGILFRRNEERRGKEMDVVTGQELFLSSRII